MLPPVRVRPPPGSTSSSSAEPVKQAALCNVLLLKEQASRHYASCCEVRIPADAVKVLSPTGPEALGGLLPSNPACSKGGEEDGGGGFDSAAGDLKKKELFWTGVVLMAPCLLP